MDIDEKEEYEVYKNILPKAEQFNDVELQKTAEENSYDEADTDGNHGLDNDSSTSDDDLTETAEENLYDEADTDGNHGLDNDSSTSDDDPTETAEENSYDEADTDGNHGLDNDSSTSDDDPIGTAEENSYDDEKLKKFGSSEADSSFYGRSGSESENDETEETAGNEERKSDAFSSIIGEADEDGDYRKVNQTAAIASAEPSSKEEKSESYVNLASMFDRKKGFLVLLLAGGLFFIFLFFIAPYLTPKRKAKKAEMEQAQSVTAPDFVKDMDIFVDDNVQDSENEDYDSSIYNDFYEEDLAQKFPEPTAANGFNRGYSDIPSSTQTVPYEEEIDTSRNEQQKFFADITLTDSPNIKRVQDIIGSLNARQNAERKLLAAQENAKNYRSYTPAAITQNTDDYNQALIALIAQGIDTTKETSYSQINDQISKQKFASNGAGTGGSYSYTSEYSLWKGTIIPAVLDTAIDTDLPGMIKATVTENVYSSLDGRYLLIPQGSQLIAQYSSSVSYAQERVQVAWETLIRPDGLEINLGNLPGISSDGSTGYEGKVNHHTFQLAKGLGLIAVFTVLETKLQNQMTKFKENKVSSKGEKWAGNTYYDNLSEVMTDGVEDIGEKWTDNAMNIQPTIKVSAGEKINLITNVTMDIPPLKKELAESRYVLNK